MQTLFQDLRYGIRLLGKNPGFTAAVVLILAIGIGATTAIYSVVHAVLLQPLPFREPERLVAIWEKNPEKGWHKNVVAPANFLDWKEQASSFEGMAAYAWWIDRMAMTGSGEPEMVSLNNVTADFFSVLGIEPQLGRTFRPDEATNTGDFVAIISHGLWQRRFAGDPDVLGKTLMLDGYSFAVVGVMPQEFSLPGTDVSLPGAKVELWVPFRWNPEDRHAVWFRRAHFLRSLGRLKPEATLDRAEEELALIARRLEQQYPETNKLMGTGLTPLHEWVAGDVQKPLLILMCGVGLVLLIACANVANLLLSRWTVRNREVAVRQALGASRLRLVRQFLSESLILWVAGGSLGLLLAYWGIDLLIYVSPIDLPQGFEVGIGGSALLFALGLTLMTGVLFGLVPALGSSRASAGEVLRGGRTGLLSLKWGKVRNLLVTSQIALALVLAVGAGLLVKSFVKLQRVDPGFQSTRVLSFKISLPETKYSTGSQTVQFFRDLLEKLRALPGVESAGAVSQLPLMGHSWSSDFFIKGRAPDEYGVEVIHREVTPDYFHTMGVPLVRGRLFTDADHLEGPRAIIINQALARRYFPNENPLGQEICFDRVPHEKSVWRTVIGVVGNERQENLIEESRPEIFEPHLQYPRRSMTVLMRTAFDDPAVVLEAARKTVQGLDAGLPIYDVRSLKEVLSTSVSRQEALAFLMSGFAWVAILLSVVGLYGTLAYVVSRRLQEMGIRMALGATGLDIMRMVLGESAIMLAVGLIAGVAGSLAMTRYLSALLYEVSPVDPVTFLAACLLLVGFALLATYLPARRAAKVDPMVALRYE